jgi:hypothetical protein
MCSRRRWSKMRPRMSLSKAPRYLLDVNVFLALLSENHMHHQLVTKWFNTPGLQWAICPFTEAGFLRNATAPRAGQITMSEATAILARITQEPGYHYQPIFHSALWHQASHRCLSSWSRCAKPYGPGHHEQSRFPSCRRRAQQIRAPADRRAIEECNK